MLTTEECPEMNVGTGKFSDAVEMTVEPNIISQHRVLCCEKRSCHARRHNDLEGHSNFSSPIYSFSVLCLEHHYCGDQQWRSLT